MGAYCYLFLPFDVEPTQVAQVMAILLGARAKLIPVANDAGETSQLLLIRGQPGVRMSSPDRLGPLEIDIGDDAKDYLEHMWPNDALTFSPALFPNIREGGKTHHQVTFGSRPLPIAVAVRVASWFGGRVVPNSYDEAVFEEIVRGCPTDDRGDVPYRGEPLERYLKALVALRAIDEQDVEKFRGKAAHQ